MEKSLINIGVDRIVYYRKIINNTQRVGDKSCGTIVRFKKRSMAVNPAETKWPERKLEMNNYKTVRGKFREQRLVPDLAESFEM